MGQHNSKDELLYNQVIEGNIDGIKSLFTQGARLEWIDKEGKTPLIVASMDPRLYIVAKTLIELGANVNSYRPGRHAGTPLHHAAKRGLDSTVKLLISRGANPFTRNDDVQTPLDVARMKGHCNVVRTIEVHVSYFSGDIQEVLVVSSILEPLVPQRLSRKRSRKCWVVVVPRSLPNPAKPPKLELAVYNSPQDPQPRTIIALWKCNIAEPKSQELDPTLVIVNTSNGTRYKFLSAIEGDRRQLTQLYSACKGFPEVTPPLLSNEATISSVPLDPLIPPEGNTRPVVPQEDSTNGWGDISSSSTHNKWDSSTRPANSKASTSGWTDQPATNEYNGWASSPDPTIPTTSQVINLPSPVTISPSAPPLPGDILDDGPINYPMINSSPVDTVGLTVQGEASTSKNTEENSCVICWDAPVEGACIPCGHMAGCMSCLTEIKGKNGDCPVCRAKIDQVIRLYTV